MSSIDVIIPCYRYAHFLRQCVGSVLAQSFQNVRVLIIDDASPDNTAEVAGDLTRNDSRVTFLRHTRNIGHIKTYNEGIEWASADYMLILSADDYLLPGALSRAASLMDAHPEVGLTFGKAAELDGTTKMSLETVVTEIDDEPSWRILTGPAFIELSGPKNIVRTPTAVVRTELQKRLGGYRPELPHAGDMEMWLRFAANASIGVSNSYHAVYRRHEANMSLEYMTAGWLPDLEQRKAAFDYFFETVGYMLPSSRSLLRRLFWLLAYDAMSLASTAFNQGDLLLSESISSFAVNICPEVRKSLRWRKLLIKRCLGLTTCRILRPIVGANSSRQ